jgi:serine/threonine-protein kinase
VVDEPTKTARPTTADPTVSGPTVSDRPTPRSATGSGTNATVLTTEQAMVLIEARRAWAFSLGLWGACLAGLAMVAACGGDPRARVLHTGALIATGVAAFTHVVVIRDRLRNRRWMVVVVGLIASVANTTGYLYWGAFSAYAAVVPVAAYSYATGSGKRDGAAVFACSIIGHLAVGFAAIFGWTSILSIMPMPGIPVAAMVAVLAVLQGIVIAALAGGNHAYRAMQQAVSEHGAAVRELALRDAQLAEAHEAARDARRGPDEGRHSGAMLGRFKLGTVLGRGAMGEVYAAVDDRGEPCAVKVLVAALLGNDDVVRRFHREARAIASLDSPNIVRMIDVSPPDAPLPYIAMERLTGRDLGELVKQQPVRDLAEVTAIVDAIAAGLDAAHDAGVVHRDLKPANLFRAVVGANVTWKILDFGVSKVVAAESTMMTANQVVGTPGYMAPEQARGDVVDRRADVYSLGVVVYRLLSGRPAVVPGDVAAMIHEVVYRMPPAPSTIGAVTPEVEAVLAVALAKSPGDRFASAGELARAFDAAVAGKLPGDVALRAAGILARTPWGQWLRRGSEHADRRASATTASTATTPRAIGG